MARKIPATIVTGFLGAGKTSLIRHLVETARGRRIAFIINEFGDVGVDGALVEGCAERGCAVEEIVELANGCLCCTVADDFLPTLEALLARDPAPDQIVIETSGLALPKPLLQAFAWPDIKHRVTVDGVIALVDAPAVAAGRFAEDPDAVARQRAADPSLDHDNPLAEVFEDQLAAADMVVLNKADGLAPDRLEATSGYVAERLRRGVRVFAATHGRVPVEVLLGLSAAAETDLASRPSHHDGGADHDHDDFESFVVDLPEIADPDALATRLARIAADHDILRVKGFVAIAGVARRCVIQGVGDRFDRHFDRAWSADETRAGALVVIGKKGLDRAAITAAMRGSN